LRTEDYKKIGMLSAWLNKEMFPESSKRGDKEQSHLLPDKSVTQRPGTAMLLNMGIVDLFFLLSLVLLR
jgi:hypothetical protein